jgi:hypothetical protein
MAVITFTDAGEVATIGVTEENALELAQVALEIARQLVALHVQAEKREDDHEAVGRG